MCIHHSATHHETETKPVLATSHVMFYSRVITGSATTTSLHSFHSDATLHWGKYQDEIKGNMHYITLPYICNSELLNDLHTYLMHTSITTHAVCWKLKLKWKHAQKESMFDQWESAPKCYTLKPFITFTCEVIATDSVFPSKDF